MSNDNHTPESEIIRYVVVVHGIGEQVENATLISAVNRFAEARRGASETKNVNALTLGMTSGQTGPLRRALTPWVEFDGIPADPSVEVETPFLGEASTSGDNLRFVDMHWQGVLQESYEEAGQGLEGWSDGLISRVKMGRSDLPKWVLPALYRLQETVVLVRKAMAYRVKEFEELVFSKFLGDVQVYGEYAQCRGRAVRLFHDRMDQVHQRHIDLEGENGRKAQYTIIAHSLGSIMTLDALLYAHASDEIRSGSPGDFDLSNVPFQGYLEKGLSTPGVGWRENVDSLVTLGSPIDKFLTLWWLNYRYLGNPGKWIDKDRNDHKIGHFNYAEEQDPVGHELDVARETAAYQQIFEPQEDEVYHRFAIPGVAHNRYWKDLDLFKRILHLAVDCPSGKADPNDAPELEWFLARQYVKTIGYSYLVIPLIVILANVASFFSAYQAETWQTSAVGAAIFVLVCWLGRRLILLNIWWRQILRQKHQKTDNCKMAQNQLRQRLSFVVRLGLPVFALLSLFGVFASFTLHYSHCELGEALPGHPLSAILGGSVTLLFLIWQRLRARERVPFRDLTWWRLDLSLGVALAVAAVLGYFVGTDLGLTVHARWAGWTDPSCGGNNSVTFGLVVFSLISGAVWIYTALRLRFSRHQLRG